MAGLRQNILDNLRTDLLTIDGSGDYTNTISTALKDLRLLKDVTGFDAVYVGALDDSRKSTNETAAEWTLSVACVVYFKASTDTQNAGTLETKCESFIEDLHTLDKSWANAMDSLDADSKKPIQFIELTTVEPYLNTGFDDRGTIYFEIKINYIRG